MYRRSGVSALAKLAMKVVVYWENPSEEVVAKRMVRAIPNLLRTIINTIWQDLSNAHSTRPRLEVTAGSYVDGLAREAERLQLSGADDMARRAEAAAKSTGFSKEMLESLQRDVKEIVARQETGQGTTAFITVDGTGYPLAPVSAKLPAPQDPIYRGSVMGSDRLYGVVDRSGYTDEIGAIRAETFLPGETKSVVPGGKRKRPKLPPAVAPELILEDEEE